MDRLFVAIGAVSACLAVVIGAFGAHGLKGRLPADLSDILEVGARYQMYHSLGLLGVAWAASRWPSAAVHAAGWLFVAGIVLFSGSLYALSLTGVRKLGAVTPLGGLGFMAGWLLLAWSVWRHP